MNGGPTGERKLFNGWHRSPFLVFIGLLVVASLGLSGCSGASSGTGKGGLRPYTSADVGLGARAVFPSYVTVGVRDAYEFAVAHPEVLAYMPCYCGCGLNVGHRSNLNCFIAGVEEGGQALRFTDHARYCDICLEIARDARQLLAEGKSLSAIRDYVDLMHGGKGPGTDTPRPLQ